jgi:recombination protein RecT
MNNLVKTNNETILQLQNEAINIIQPQAQSDNERLLTNSLYYLNEETKKNKQLGTAIQANPVKFAIYLKNLITLGVDISQRQAYFLPYGKEITSVLDYKTLMALIKKHTNVKSIDAQLVYENETFHVEQGKVVEHRQNPFASKDEKGALVGAYSIFTLDDGSKDYYFASLEEINKVKECSESANSKYSKFSPWNNWYEEMVKKTVIRKGMKFYPMILDNEQRIALDSVDNDVDFNLNKKQNVVQQNVCPEKKELLDYMKENNLNANEIAKTYRLTKESEPQDYAKALNDLKEKNGAIDVSEITPEQLDKEMEDIANAMKME